MLRITGGTGFIVANFVLDWLAAIRVPIINLDKLTPSMSAACCGDPTIGIQWSSVGASKLAAKDAAGKVLAEAVAFA